MAMKMTRIEMNQRAELSDRLREAFGGVEDAVNEFNEKLADLLGPVHEALDGYRLVRDEAVGWVTEFAEEKRSEYDEKTERWQESDKGQAADSWISELESFDPDEIEPDLPSAIDISGYTPAEESLNDLPEAPEDV